jgi:hypothetical protein
LAGVLFQLQLKERNVQMKHDDPVLTEQQLFEYLRYERGLVGVSRNSVKYAVLRRKITPTQIGCKNWFSKRDGDAWIESCKSPEPSIFTGVHAGRKPKTHAAQ